jgi:HlyD family secretion protein
VSSRARLALQRKLLREAWTLRGQVATIALVLASGIKASVLGVDEQRVNVIVALTDPRSLWLALGDDYRVRARLVLWRADDRLRVPLGALFRHSDGWAVFTIDGNTAHRVSITVGHRGETEAEVLSGLVAGVRVAVHPGDRVADDVRVRVNP